jgi:hypothetical protein
MVQHEHKYKPEKISNTPKREAIPDPLLAQ